MVEVGVTPVIALPAAVLRVVPEVKNVPVVEFTFVTTVVFVVVPFRNGTVRMGRSVLLPNICRLLGGLFATLLLLAP